MTYRQSALETLTRKHNVSTDSSSSRYLKSRNKSIREMGLYGASTDHCPGLRPEISCLKEGMIRWRLRAGGLAQVVGLINSKP
jgi:hypothetical protein